MRRATVIWVLAAVLGLVVAGGVMAAASHLSGQRVGLSSEPLTAGDRLAPARAAAARPRRTKTAPVSEPSTSTQPETPAQEQQEQATGDERHDGDD